MDTIDDVYMEILGRYPSRQECDTIIKKNIVNVKNMLETSTEYRNKVYDEKWNVYVKNTLSTVQQIKPKFEDISKDRCVVMVEPRQTNMIEYVLKNIFYYLEHGWVLYIFHSKKNKEYVYNLTKDWNHVNYIELSTEDLLPNGLVKTGDVPLYDILFKTYKFWELIKYEWILTVQTDTLMRRHGLEKYLKYDYIGAPWPNREVGCGGFSIRKKSEMIKICKQHSYQSDINESEDIFFSKHAKNKAPFEIAKTFCVEHVFYDNPIAIHRPGLNSKNLSLLFDIHY